MVKEYKHIIFDLDGTLTDSKPGIINAAFYALEKMGIKNSSDNKIHDLIGIPLQEYLKEIAGFDEIETDQAVMHFRKYYGEKGVYENKVYSGIPELLKKLKDSGKKLYISTAKYEKYAWVVSNHFGFTPLINDLVGADAGGRHATKTELAAKIIERNNINDLKSTVMVGDKYMDIEAGHNTGIDSIAVTYGFGSEDELKNANPTHLVHSVEELRFLICLEYGG